MRFGGSSIGIEVAADWVTARALLHSVHMRAGAVVEPYLPESFDLNVAVRANPDVQLSAIERPIRSSDKASILGYADKYLGGEGMVSAPRQLPAEIPSEMEKQLRQAAVDIAAVAGVRGVARIDFLCHDDKLYVNEINTIPGSLAKYLWVEPTVPFTTLLTDMITKGMGLRREDVYIANILKCRPPENRTPTPEEAANCSSYLDHQIAACQRGNVPAIG